jgi:hypothetical protein
MKWESKTLTEKEKYNYVPVEYALVKETPKAIRIKIDKPLTRYYLSNKNYNYEPITIEGICVWVPKSIVRNYTDKKAYIWVNLLRKNVTKVFEKYIRAKLGLDKEEPLIVVMK